MKGPMHLEIITRIQEKTVLCVHWNETNIVEGLKCKFVIYNRDSVTMLHHLLI